MKVTLTTWLEVNESILLADKQTSWLWNEQGIQEYSTRRDQVLYEEFPVHSMPINCIILFASKAPTRSL